MKFLYFGKKPCHKAWMRLNLKFNGWDKSKYRKTDLCKYVSCTYNSAYCLLKYKPEDFMQTSIKKKERGFL
jgi:hypothetical protein